MQNFNPYDNQYNHFNNFGTFSTKPNSLIFVNGIEGAKSYQLAPNQMVMLVDSDEPIVYKKTSNSYGQAVVEAFELVPIKQREKISHETEYVLKSDFDALVKRIDEITKKEGDLNE